MFRMKFTTEAQDKGSFYCHKIDVGVSSQTVVK